MGVALWIVLLICVLWIALSEMPAGWDGHLPLPYLIALTPLLWIPTLAIATIGAVRHDTALPSSRQSRASLRCCAKSRIGTTISRPSTRRRWSPTKSQKIVKHLVKHMCRLLLKLRNMAVSV